MCEEGRVVRRVNRKESRNDQHKNREPQEHAHRHLNPAEPAHTDDVHQVKENQTADGEQLMIELAADAPAAQLDDVIGQSAREISTGADVSDYLQPRSDVCDAKPA